MTNDQILNQEYSFEFDDLRRNRVAVSFHKYGPSKTNFKEGLVSAIGSLEKCLKKYQDTGNTEYLCDAGNYLMFEFMYPQHPEAHFRATDGGESAGIDGMSIKEMENFKSENC